MKTFGLLFICATLGLFVNAFSADDEDQEKADGKKTPAALNFTMKSIDGNDVELSKYQGKVVVMVNVASKCGLTPQYKSLQGLHDKYAESGLAILGFPCNQFGGQEPGSEEDIKQFCEDNYDVKFDMFAKVNVNGDERCDLYSFLTQVDSQPKGSGDVKWNFEKFVVDRNGEVIARFAPGVKPDSDEFVSVIEDALNDK